MSEAAPRRPADWAMRIEQLQRLAANEKRANPSPHQEMPKPQGRSDERPAQD
ncbi:hypothetical protein [Variovorax defluvii]|uniref:hypothetical protein n=1 Tax=Variovorax defluvii TaxID=913761 RepID=UPI0031F0FF28